MSVENLVQALREYENNRTEANKQLARDAAKECLINTAGYSCVESIMTLRYMGYMVAIDSSIGYPVPTTEGRVIGSDFEIKYGNADGRVPEATLS